MLHAEWIRGMMCFLCFSFEQSVFFLSSKASLLSPPDRQVQMNSDDLWQISWWQMEQDVPLPTLWWLIPCGSQTSSRPIFSLTSSREGLWLFNICYILYPFKTSHMDQTEAARCPVSLIYFKSVFCFQWLFSHVIGYQHFFSYLIVLVFQRNLLCM